MNKIFAANGMYEQTLTYAKEYGSASAYRGYRGSENLDWHTLVLGPLKGLLAKIMGFIPDLVAAIGILIVGWIVSKIFMIVIRKFLTAINFNKIAEKTGVADLLSENEASTDPITWMSRLVFWIGIFITVISAIGVLRLDIVSSPLGEFGFYFSSMAITFLILVFGLFLSIILSKIVETTAATLKVARPKLFGSIVKWSIIVFTFILVANKLGLDRDVISMVFAALLVTFCVILILTFGLGGREWAAKVLDRFLK